MPVSPPPIPAYAPDKDHSYTFKAWNKQTKKRGKKKKNTWTASSLACFSSCLRWRSSCSSFSRCSYSFSLARTSCLLFWASRVLMNAISFTYTNRQHKNIPTELHSEENIQVCAIGIVISLGFEKINKYQFQPLRLENFWPSPLLPVLSSRWPGVEAPVWIQHEAASPPSSFSSDPTAPLSTSSPPSPVKNKRKDQNPTKQSVEVELVRSVNNMSISSADISTCDIVLDLTPPTRTKQNKNKHILTNITFMSLTRSESPWPTKMAVKWFFQHLCE